MYRKQGSRLSSRKRNAKRLSEEALQIAEEKREAKGKREKERYNHKNTEFQRIARRDKKPFLSDQCKEIEENSRNTRGIFHAKMGSIKDRNSMDLTESRLLGEISITSDMQMTPPLWQKVKRNLKAS